MRPLYEFGSLDRLVFVTHPVILLILLRYYREKMALWHWLFIIGLGGALWLTMLIAVLAGLIQARP